MKNGLVVLVIILALGASHAPSEEAARSSIATVREALSEERRQLFDEAVLVVSMDGVTDKGLLALAFDPEGIKGQALRQLHGKTGEEVIAGAHRITAAREARERDQAIKELAELEQKQIASAAAKRQLAAFEVVKSRFYFRKQGFLGPEPVIELTVRNGSTEAISAASFVGTLASPGRAVPWLKDSFSYKIAGGLEPGEQAIWRLAPNMFSAWGKVEWRNDMILTVEVQRLDGADGKAIAEATFGDGDAKRLEALRSKFATAK